MNQKQKQEDKDKITKIVEGIKRMDELKKQKVKDMLNYERIRLQVDFATCCDA